METTLFKQTPPGLLKLVFCGEQLSYSIIICSRCNDVAMTHEKQGNQTTPIISQLYTSTLILSLLKTSIPQCLDNIRSIPINIRISNSISRMLVVVDQLSHDITTTYNDELLVTRLTVVETTLSIHHFESLWIYQLLSTIINNYQQLSTTLNYYQSPETH